MREYDLPPSGDPEDGKANRFDGASIPRAHAEAAGSSASAFGVRDVGLEALLRQLDAALEAIRSLDEEIPEADGV